MIPSLDAAFIGIGVDAAFRDPTTGNYDGGELELVVEVLAFGPLLDAHYQTHFGKEGYPGCWLYEITEAFGEWCARQLMSGAPMNNERVNHWLMVSAPPEDTRKREHAAWTAERVTA